MLNDSASRVTGRAVRQLGCEVFEARRRKFMARLGEGVAILPSAPVAFRSNDVEYPYRQDSDFFYLTGFAEPESVALFAPGNKEGEFILFVRPRDRERETWTGERAGIEGAMTRFGADRAYPIAELNQHLPRYLEEARQVYFPLAPNCEMTNRVLELIRSAQQVRPRLGKGPEALVDPRPLVHEMRLFKEAAELELMRIAAEISAEAHRRAMTEAAPGMFEWQIEALVDYVFRSSGATGPAYPSIVASGPNATVLHYTNNNRSMEAGDLLLLDAGCEYSFYAADITRTFPVGGRFTSVQRDLYSLVLAAQAEAIQRVAPGVPLEEIHDVAVRTLVEGLRSLGLLHGSVEENLDRGDYRRFYMHRTSHWLGMDVHDVGDYRRGDASRRLEPGMVVTVEPGLYLSRDDDTIPHEMRGIGIRIEDDVLVTHDGHEVLSSAAPKEIAQIETLTVR